MQSMSVVFACSSLAEDVFISLKLDIEKSHQIFNIVDSFYHTRHRHCKNEPPLVFFMSRFVGYGQPITEPRRLRNAGVHKSPE